MRLTMILLALAGLSACNQKEGNGKAPEQAKPAELTYEGGDYRDDAAKLAHGG